MVHQQSSFPLYLLPVLQKKQDKNHEMFWKEGRSAENSFSQLSDMQINNANLFYFLVTARTGIRAPQPLSPTTSSRQDLMSLKWMPLKWIESFETKPLKRIPLNSIASWMDTVCLQNTIQNTIGKLTVARKLARDLKDRNIFPANQAGGFRPARCT